MKTNAIVRIILFSILALVLVGILAMSIMGYLGFRAFAGVADTVSSYEQAVDPVSGEAMPAPEGSSVGSHSAAAKAEGIRELEIKWLSGDVTIEAGNVEEIQFSETASDRPMHWYVQEDTLTIQFWEGKWPIVGPVPGKYRKDLKVVVPREWAAEEISIEAVEADVELRNLVAEELEFDGVSGKFQAENCRIGEVDMDTVSGNIVYGGTLMELDVDGVSADCTLNLTNVPREIQMDGVSGDLELTLPADAGLDVKVESASGKLTTDFAGTQSGKSFYCGDGACRVTVDGVSGSVRIYKAK